MPYGSGKYTYELVDGWAKLPEGASFLDIGGISIDAQDRVYVLNRSTEHPVMVFDREGNFLTYGGRDCSSALTAAVSALMAPSTAPMTKTIPCASSPRKGRYL